MINAGKEFAIVDALESAANDMGRIHVTANHALKNSAPLDIDACASAFRRVYSHKLSIRKHTEGLAPTEFSKLCIDEKQNVLGFISFGYNRDEVQKGEIYFLYVHPDHWHKGLGSRLFNSATETLRENGCTTLHLRTNTNDAIPNSFYKKHNGQEVPSSIAGQNAYKFFL